MTDILASRFVTSTGHRCLSWVKVRSPGVQPAGRLCSQLRTSPCTAKTDALCQQETHAPQKRAAGWPRRTWSYLLRRPLTATFVVRTSASHLAITDRIDTPPMAVVCTPTCTAATRPSKMRSSSASSGGQERRRGKIDSRTFGRVSVWIFWHQFDLPKCQVHWGSATVCLNVHFDGPFVYFLHFAAKTSKRTIDDLYDAAFESLLIFSHTTIRFS